MSTGDVSLSPTSAPPERQERHGLEQLPTLTRLLYRWCVGLINRTLERFPGLRHGLARLEAAETTIRRLRLERDEALGFLRERNNELAHYDTALRNLFAAVGEVGRELDAVQRDVVSHQQKVAEHVGQLVNHILQLQQSLREAALDMQEAQADLDAVAAAFRRHQERVEQLTLQLQQRLWEAALDMEDAQTELDGIARTFRNHQSALDRRIGLKDMALLSMLDAAREAEAEMDLLTQHVQRHQKVFSRTYHEALAENNRLSQELETIVAEVAQTNSLTAAHIQALEAELAALRAR